MMKRTIYLSILLLFAILSGCKKELVPIGIENSAAGKINYYSTSEVLKRYGSDQLFGVGIFIDTIPNSLKPINSVTADNIPYLTYIPRNSTLIEYPVVTGQTTPTYLSYPVGKHQLRFSLMKSNGKGIVQLPDLVYAQAEVNLTFDNKTLLYLVDGPVQEQGKPAFNVIDMQLPEIPKTEAGKIGLRVLHVSPDVGALSVTLVKSDGSEIKTNLPQALTYGEFTQEIPINVLDAYTNGLLKLKIMDKNGTLLFYTGIPALQQHGYTLIVKGFQKKHTIQVPQSVGSDENRTVNYGSVNMPASLAVDIRQMY